MKNRTLILLTSAMLLTTVTIGCSQDHQGDQAQETIVLNHSEKWIVHDNMMVHVVEIADAVDATTKDKDYSGLNAKLLTGISALTSDCTMDGQAHEELHKWLLPFIGKVKEFSPDMTVDKQNSWFGEVQAMMAEFNTYFE